MYESREILIVTAHRSREGFVADAISVRAEPKSSYGTLVCTLSLLQTHYG